MSIDTVPDRCECGGRLEYFGQECGIEFWKCAVSLCAKVYDRFMDSIGG